MTKKVVLKPYKNTKKALNIMVLVHNGLRMSKKNFEINKNFETNKNIELNMNFETNKKSN